jgi:hypothetical protein
MANSKRRKIEVYRLVISGLKEKSDYLQLVRRARNSIEDEHGVVQTIGEKSHVLHEVRLTRQALWLRFYSYSGGERPDVIDTESLNIKPNPLSDNETQVYWTHALVAKRPRRVVMLIERVQTGIWPSRIEDYLQWLFERPENESLLAEVQADPSEPVTVNLELETDKSFMKQVDQMDRIIAATLRIIRPNPGWMDYDDLLSKEAQASDAKYADVGMHARRNASLKKDDGIIKAMKDLDQHDKLGRAVVEGEVEGEQRTISTEKHGKSQYKNLPTNPEGIVAHDAAIEKFLEYLDEVD